MASAEPRLEQPPLQALRDAANRLRVTSAAGSGHRTSCCSAAEITAVLFFQAMRYRACQPAHPSNDRFVLSKVGYRVFCLLGDGEVSEGSVWEALAFGSHYRLDNLVAIVDVNRLGQSDVYRRCEAFGWNTYVVDGHAVEELDEALRQAASREGEAHGHPGQDLQGTRRVEDAENWHGKPMPKDKVEYIISAIRSRIQTHEVLVPQPPIEDIPQISIAGICMPSPPEYTTGDKVATRKACGVALAKLGAASERVVALDEDTKNSTFSELFKQAHPERYIECYIAEQNMVSVALGCAARDRAVVFASTFAAFFTRAFDHIRMGAISQSNLNLCGSHCGGRTAPEDIAMFRVIPGCTVFYPSDAVSTERAVCLAANTKGICFIRTSRPETPVTYPPEKTFEIGQAKLRGWEGGRVVRKSDADRVTVIGAGVTLHEALAAADELAKQGTHIRVIDPFTIKPFDATTIVTSAQATGGRIITVEDHYREAGEELLKPQEDVGPRTKGRGLAKNRVMLEISFPAIVGLGEPGMVLQGLAVCGVPQSGKPAELLDLFGISTKSIVAAVKNSFAN
ncbi:transketolase-like protein 1 [Gopherus flavomarginatus]|uniref:transketolase-like protein 1 n=1 Tax=Gopherus flavomarginatus TaxID=286002 RepID=UPI0021CC1CF3|nr:transketolase-like protein 1 [Gopherus flavomarginatus]